ncbi:MAG: NfeD-like protein [Moorea sp. SIO2B7]|nr:NfeD-like protein [Moorena sp. SIO2B7]
MFTIYLFSFIIGGIFVSLAVVAGFDGTDFDHDFDTDIEISDHSNHDQEALIKRKQRRKLPRLPFTSLKFWTFGSCFFGLTGILLSILQTNMAPGLIASISVAIGLICGTSIVSVLRNLRQNQADSLVRPDDLIGLCGIVEIPFDSNSKGKIRVNVKGSIIDFVALTENTRELTKGDNVLVVGMENNKVWVVSQDALESGD